MVFTAYGLTAAVAAWLSGALSDLWGPRRVMWAGLGIWVVFEVAFLLLGVAPNSYPMIFLLYALRGFGYPLFAFGFLVWVTAATPARRGWGRRWAGSGSRSRADCRPWGRSSPATPCPGSGRTRRSGARWGWCSSAA